MTNEDDLTIKIGEFIYANNKIVDDIKKGKEKTGEDPWFLL
jgi:hypothetical protein